LKRIIMGKLISTIVMGSLVVAATPGGSSIVLGAEPKRDVLAYLEGWYLSPHYCTDENGVQYPKETPCALVRNNHMKTLEGWLAIKRIDRTHAKFEVQAARFATPIGDCLVYGTAELKGPALIFKPSDDSADGNGLQIEKEGSELKVRYSPGTQQSTPNTYCHGDVSLTSLILKISDKRPLDECGCEIKDL
jgi:hypothetical protein